MPGHILLGRCVCGFERKLWPGATAEHSRVIAYTADGRDLITIESEQATNQSLAVIKDPRFEDEWPSYGPWGPYRCPSCVRRALRMEFSGFWD
jgi:hypothetical protein